MIPVVPLPVSVSTSDGVLRLIDGCSVGAQDHALDGLVEQFVEDVAADTGLRLTVVGLGGDIRLALSPAGSPTTDTVIGVNPRGGEPADERHQLQVTPTGATVEATTVEGVFRGLTTLRQLISAGRQGDEALVSAMEVRDGPRYAWRGLSLDVARTFHGPEQVRRVIDIMALHKFNVLHLHLTDDQGWRLEVPGWPALTTIGAAGAVGDRPGGFFSQQEFTDLVRYAADRWITVVPEVDMPGHCGAAIRAYPELGASPNVLDPDSPSVQAFLTDVVATMAELAPGPWLHIGGDEAFGMAPDAYRRFVDMARRTVLDAGRRPVLWQEAARSTTAPTEVVQHWMAFDPVIEQLLDSGDLERLAPPGTTVPLDALAHIAEMFRAGKADVARAVAEGARILLSPASYAYLDRPYAEAPTDPDQADLQRRLGLRVYPRKTVEELFDWDPGDVIDAGPESVAGVEAAVWCETVATGAELEFLLLPRLAGVGERAWSRSPGAPWSSYRDRLGPQGALWRRRGWNYFTSSLVDWPTTA